MKTLIVLAHPDINNSKVNKRWKEELEKHPKDIIIHELYKEYPDWNVDVGKEQHLLESTDSIIFQFPLYWYSYPPLLKDGWTMFLPMVLILLSTLAIRERKYEIGVLRAMGMKKVKVALGLLTELLVITGFCLILGLGIGMAASKPVADSLLANQIELAEENSNTNNAMQTTGSTGLGAPTFSSDTNPLSELQISLNMDAIMKIILISFVLAGISSIAGIMYITKYEPIKILSERN